MALGMMTRRMVLSAVVLVVGIAFVVRRAGSSALRGGDPFPTHQVESLEELVVRLGGCPDFPLTSVAGSSRGLSNVPSATLDCPHLVYLWSPSMPLSLHGMEEITQTAEVMGVPLSMIPTSALHGSAGGGGSQDKALGAGLVAAGATVHFPSVVVFDRGSPRGNAIVGYRRSEGYRRLLEPRLAALAAGEVGDPAPIGAPAPPLTGVGTGGSEALDIRVRWTYPMPAPALGAFFRRVPGTRFITFTQSERVHLLDLKTSERLLGPGFVDFVPSPDGKLFVTPGPGATGLEFYVASEVFRLARRGTPNQFTTAFTDPLMADQYPSVGILAEAPDGMRTTYRILVSWFAGLAVRDYEVRWDQRGSATVTPLTPKIAACPGMGLSIPIMSKDGREIAARDEATGTTKVFRLNGEGGCTELFDIGRQTSKVGFSDDGRLIAYSSPNGSGRRAMSSTTYVLDRQDMRITTIPNSESVGLVIPEVIGADSLLILVREDVRSAESEFRLLCCVRGLVP